MKRVEYRKPSIEIVKIYNQTLLAGSDPSSQTTDQNGNPLPGENIEFGGSSSTGDDFKL